MAPKVVFYIFLLGWMWGPSFLFIKLATVEIPPLTAATLRIIIGVTTLMLFLKIKKIKLPPFGKIWMHFAFMGVISNALPFTLFFYGEKYVSCSVAALINGAPPIYTAILAHFFLKDEKINVQKVCGVACGFLGLLFMTYQDLVTGVSVNLYGFLAIVLATLCYASGFIYAKKFLKGCTPLVAPASQLTVAAFVMVPIVLMFENPFELQMPSWTAIGSLLFLGIPGTGIAYIFYYKIIDLAGAMALSMIAYLLPVIGLFLGALVLHESISPYAYGGGTLILASMFLVNTAQTRKQVELKQ